MKPALGSGARLAVLTVLLALLTAARPFGMHEISGGGYFGVYVRNWENLGFFATRGLPLLPEVVTDVGQAVPYTNHPPGLAWICALTGGSEAGLRLPAIVALFAAGWLLCELLSRRFPRHIAVAAGALLIAMPVFSVYCLPSYEPLTCAFGLGLWLAIERHLERGSRLALGAAIACAALGIWADWLFAFFVAALPLWTGLPADRARMRALLLPGAAMLLSALAILGWTTWARALPALQPGLAETAHSVVERAVLDRPAADDVLSGTLARLRAGFTWPILITGALGWLLLARRHLRFALATLSVQLMTVIVFPHHVMTHVLFIAYLAIPLAAGIAALAARLGLWLLLAALVWTLTHTARQIELASTPFFAEFGRVATAAAGPDDHGREYWVATNNPYIFRYYVPTTRVLREPVVRIPELQAGLAQITRGARYLHLACEGPLLELIPYLRPIPELTDWLQPFTRRRLPELELQLRLPPDGTALEITEAWIYELR